MLHVVDSGFEAPVLRRDQWTAIATRLLLSACAHGAIGIAIAVFANPPRVMPASALDSAQVVIPNQIRHVVFLAPQTAAHSTGGGGGGNRHAGPIRHAEATGTDAITLRVARSISNTSGEDLPLTTLAAIVLDAKPLASGNLVQIGLPEGGVSFGTSTGPGSGGGVGDGAGTGIGSGHGSGIGPGAGVGIGGGVHRPGAGVTAPRVISEVTPSYTVDALFERIQGTVVLEFIVRADGIPSNFRVVRSLDPGRLDAEAIRAASQWRFEPGRLAGTPVDVLVRLAVDFSIR